MKGYVSQFGKVAVLLAPVLSLKLSSNIGNCFGVSYILMPI
jgi:hypothetical protein